jgi:copper chaperone CopZ
MRDNNCRVRVSEALEAVSGVRDVCVNLFRAQATVDHESDCDPAALVESVARAGFAARVTSR